MDLVKDSFEVGLDVVLTVLAVGKLLSEVVFDVFVSEYLGHFLLLLVLVLVVEVVAQVRVFFAPILLYIFRLQLARIFLLHGLIVQDGSL